MTDNERICKLVKIVATSDIGKPLANDKATYLLDEQTMTVYAPYANCEMLNTLGLTIVDQLTSTNGSGKARMGNES